MTTVEELAAVAVEQLGLTVVELEDVAVRDRVAAGAGVPDGVRVGVAQWRAVVERVRAANEAAARGPRATARCKACAAPVVWIETETGRRMPLDPLPRPLDGNVIKITRGRSRVAARVLGPGDVPVVGRPAYVTHYATCPHADDFRARRELRQSRRPCCSVCEKPLDPWLPEHGYATHPLCDPSEQPRSN